MPQAESFVIQPHTDHWWTGSVTRIRYPRVFLYFLSLGIAVPYIFPVKRLEILASQDERLVVGSFYSRKPSWLNTNATWACASNHRHPPHSKQPQRKIQETKASFATNEGRCSNKLKQLSACWIQTSQDQPNFWHDGSLSQETCHEWS